MLASQYRYVGPNRLADLDTSVEPLQIVQLQTTCRRGGLATPSDHLVHVSSSTHTPFVRQPSHRRHILMLDGQTAAPLDKRVPMPNHRLTMSHGVVHQEKAEGDPCG